MDASNPGIEQDAYELAALLVQQFDKVESNKLAQAGLTEPEQAGKKGSVLIFLPGLQEIQDMENKLRQRANSDR